jgi:A/G-specific adenine glycosylase
MDSALFRRRLLFWFHKEKRSLPWRKTKDPYRILVSEMMLQQTPVTKVIPYYEKWLKAFPDIKSLAGAKIDYVLRMWQGLGYYSRARNIHKAARLIVNEHRGKLPQDYGSLKALPGIGAYTAGAVMSIAFNKRYTAVDTNIKRVMARIQCLDISRSGADSGLVARRLEKLISRKEPGDFNQAMMELGALVCRKQNPSCLACPLKVFCRACKKGVQEILPSTLKKKYVEVTAAVALINKNGRYLIQQRPSSGLLAGLWEFPGGKKDKNESIESCLLREMEEETGCKAEIKQFLLKVRHYYTRFRVTLHVYSVVLSGNLKIRAKHRWVTLDDMNKYTFPSGSVKIVDFLKTEKRNHMNR